jgi:hypothetical protein
LFSSIPMLLHLPFFCFFVACPSMLIHLPFICLFCGRPHYAHLPMLDLRCSYYNHPVCLRWNIVKQVKQTKNHVRSWMLIHPVRSQIFIHIHPVQSQMLANPAFGCNHPPCLWVQSSTNGPKILSDLSMYLSDPMKLKTINPCQSENCNQ